VVPAVTDLHNLVLKSLCEGWIGEGLIGEGLIGEGLIGEGLIRENLFACPAFCSM